MLITGIGDEVTNFFIVLLIFCVIYFGWRSTAVTPASSPVGVLIIEQNTITSNTTPDSHPRKYCKMGGIGRSKINVLYHIVVTRSDSQLSTRTETEELTVNNVIEELESDITEFIDRTTTSFGESPIVVEENRETTTDVEPSGEEQIIQAMDGDIVDSGSCGSNDGNELRHRKVTVEQQEGVKTTTETKDIENERELTIKLKYLNDDLKLVTAKATEAIGDFKK